MKKHIMSVFAIALIIASALVFSAYAEDTVGNDYYYSIDENGILTISGEGDGILDFSSIPTSDDLTMIPWLKNADTISEIIVDSEIVSAAPYAFSNLPNLTSITLPATFTDFNSEFLFANNPNLTQIKISESTNSGVIDLTGAKALSASAFAGSFDGVLPIIYLAKDLSVSALDLSEGCESITFVTYPTCAAATSVRSLIKTEKANITLDYFSEDYDSSLVRAGAESKYSWNIDTVTGKLTITRTSTSWTSITFSSTASLKAWKEIWRDAIISVEFSNFSYCAFYNSSNAGECMFANLPNLVSVHMNGITEIKEQAAGGFFSGCPSLTTVSFNSTLTENVVSLKGLKNLTGGNLDNMFDGCSSIKKVILTSAGLISGSNTYTYIYASMFNNCTALKEITIPTYITEIRANAFSGCTSLESIIIPSNVVTLGTGAFSGCSALNEVTINATGFSTSGQVFDDRANLVVYTQTREDANAIKSTFAYEQTKIIALVSESGTVGEYSWTIDGEGTLKITGEGSGALTYDGEMPWMEFANDISAISVEASITSADDYAFANLPNVKSIVLPESFTAISSEYIFANNPKLEEVDLSNATSISASAFYGSFGEASPRIMLSKSISVSDILIPDCDQITFVSYPTCDAATSVRLLIKNTDANVKLEYYSKEYDPSLVRDGSNTFGKAYTWTFDEETGKLTITSSVTSGWSANLCLDSRSTIYEWKQIWRDAIIHIETVTSASGGMIYCQNSDDEFFFANMPNLISIKIDSAYNQIQDAVSGGVFEGNPSLTTLGWGSNFKEGEVNLKGLQYWTVQEPDYMFRGCSSIKKVIFRTSSISDSADKTETPYIFASMFEGCTSLVDITLPTYITSIQSKAFAGCTSLRSVTAASTSLTSVAENAFPDIEGLVINVSNSEIADLFGDFEFTDVVYPGKFYNAVTMDGFSVRIADYNGLRGLFSVSRGIVNENEAKGFTLLEYGTIVASAENKSNCVLISDGNGGYTAVGSIKTEVWNNDDGFVGKYLSDSENKTEFAVTVVNFEEKNYQSDVYFCAYEVWQDSDGNINITYTDCAGTDYDEVSLYDISYEMWKNGIVTDEMDKDSIVKDIINSVPLDGKRIIFIGNSHIFYGNTVLCKYATDTLTQEGRMNDEGYFYQLCKANGMDVNVTNWTIGNHLFDDFFSGSCSANRGCDGVDHASYITDPYYDYVVACYGTRGQTGYIEWLDVMIDFFKEANPNVKFYLMAQSSAHGIDNRATGPDTVFLESLKTLGEKGVTVIDWGKIIADIVNGDVEVPGATLEYNKNTFVVNQSANDGYHPNQLTGYITTLMTYSIITGESAVGQPYYFCGDDSYSSDYQYRTFDEFISTYYTYNGATTNYADVFASVDDMTGIQKLIDKYIEEKPYLNYSFQ